MLSKSCRDAARRLRWIDVAGDDRREVQIREHDVELGHEARIAKRGAADRLAHATRHLQIEPVEPLEAIRVRQRGVDRGHHGENTVDRRRRGRSQRISQHDRHSPRIVPDARLLPEPPPPGSCHRSRCR
jgi:hypothetical protein